MNAEIIALQRVFVEKRKVFSIYLCSFEDLEQNEVKISNNSISYMGMFLIHLWLMWLMNQNEIDPYTYIYFSIDSSRKQMSQLYFDGILQQKSNEQKFFSLKSHVETFLKGGNVIIMNHGITGKINVLHSYFMQSVNTQCVFLNFKGTGKSSSMFGMDSENGFLIQIAEYVFNNTAINVSVVEVDGSERFDLSNAKTKIAKNSKPNCILFESLEKFAMLIANSTKIRNQQSTDQNATSSRSHYFVIFTSDRGKYLMIADLGGFECAKNKIDFKQTQFINSTLSDLNTMLHNISKGHVASGKTSLTSFLEPYMKHSNETVIMYHILNRHIKKGLDYIKDIAVSRPLKRSQRTPLADVKNKLTKTNRQ